MLTDRKLAITVAQLLAQLCPCDDNGLSDTLGVSVAEEAVDMLTSMGFAKKHTVRLFTIGWAELYLPTHNQTYESK